MNFAHLHLLLNHFPIIGTMIGCGLFFASLFKKSSDLRRSSLVIFVAMALLAIFTFVSGFPAADRVKEVPGISDALIARHTGAAELAIWFIEILGGLSLAALFQSHKTGKVAHWNVLAIVVFSLVTLGLMARTGNTGGDIRHPEDHPRGETTVTEDPASAFIHHFEPNAQKFTDDMTATKWVSWLLMAPHFLGLALIIGTVGILDLRIMGFMKQLPAAPFHKFIPWALLGLGVNVLTGMLQFIGQYYIYIYSDAFWLKMLSLLLLGVNAAVFYMTDLFPEVEHLQAGEDATMSAKLIAFSSLALWIAVIIFGRYIQPVSGSLHPN
jgi:hypothetical protein